MKLNRARVFAVQFAEDEARLGRVSAHLSAALAALGEGCGPGDGARFRIALAASEIAVETARLGRMRAAAEADAARIDREQGTVL